MKKLKIPDQLIGLVFYIVFEIITKAILYPYITKHYELGMAILIVFIFNFIFRFFLIMIYDYIKKDFFWIEKFKYELEQNQEIAKTSWIVRKIIKYKKLGNTPLFLFLFTTDPSMMVLYHRKGNHTWNNIPSIRLFFLYLGSTIFCSAAITGIIKMIIVAIRNII